MSAEVFSVIVRCWYEPQKSAMQLQVLRADTAEEVQLSDGSFLLRLFPGEGASSERCMIRHLASGREIFVQTGPKLRAFIVTYLFAQSDENEPPGTPTSGG